MSKLLNFQSPSACYEAMATAIERLINVKTSLDQVFRIALSGGNTPGPLYEVLAQKNIQWSLVEIYLVDERFVPLNDLRSNYKLIAGRLLKYLPTPIAHFHFFDTRLPLEEGLKQVDAHLSHLSHPLFDLVCLGIGLDGHVASLFSDSPLGTRYVQHTVTDHFPVRDRLSLSFKALESTRQIFFLIKGRDKKLLLNKLRMEKSQLPAARLMKDETIIYYTE